MNYQDVEVTVRVNVPIKEKWGDKRREERAEEMVKEALTDAKVPEFRRILDGTELGYIESEEEAAERRMAEAEAAHERRMEQRFAQHVDENGYF